MTPQHSVLLSALSYFARLHSLSPDFTRNGHISIFLALFKVLPEAEAINKGNNDTVVQCTISDAISCHVSKVEQSFGSCCHCNLKLECSPEYLLQKLLLI